MYLHRISWHFGAELVRCMGIDYSGNGVHHDKSRASKERSVPRPTMTGMGKNIDAYSEKTGGTASGSPPFVFTDTDYSALSHLAYTIRFPLRSSVPFAGFPSIYQPRKVKPSR